MDTEVTGPPLHLGKPKQHKDRVVTVVKTSSLQKFVRVCAHACKVRIYAATHEGHEGGRYLYPEL